MKNNLAESIVDFLSFSSHPPDRVNALKKFSTREWERVFKWLDESGLAFYFLQKLKDTNAVDAVPIWVFSRLEGNFAANQQRLEDLTHRFVILNQKFNDAGVRYAVLKGFSLIPEFCPDARLRHQSDFDYLIDDQSLLAAQKAVIDAGYIPKVSALTKELVFITPGMREPSRGGEQYSARAPHTVELHLEVWNREHNKLPSLPRLFSVEGTSIHHWNGFVFPALADEDAFLLQVVHACQHLFTLWIRTSCFFEIGYFLSRRASDAALWSRVEQRVGDNLVLRDFVVIVVEMVAKIFGPPLPPLLLDWRARIRPGARVWTESYARHWAFCEPPAYDFRLFPKAKLVLFLLQQYRDAGEHKHLVRDRMIPSLRLSHMASSIRDQPSLVLDTTWWKHHLPLRRALFHALAGLRYVCEIPRWRWRNRVRTRSAFLQT